MSGPFTSFIFQAQPPGWQVTSLDSTFLRARFLDLPPDVSKSPLKFNVWPGSSTRQQAGHLQKLIPDEAEDLGVCDYKLQSCPGPLGRACSSGSFPDCWTAGLGPAGLLCRSCSRGGWGMVLCVGAPNSDDNQPPGPSRPGSLRPLTAGLAW